MFLLSCLFPYITLPNVSLVDETCWIKEVKAFAPFVPKVPETVLLSSTGLTMKVVDNKPVEIDAHAGAK